MQSFKTSDETVWTVEVDINSLRRVKRLLGIDLLQIIDKDSNLLQQLMHPVMLCDVLYALCKPQADSMQVTDEKFGKLLGNAIEPATVALIDSITDFFQNPIERENMKKVIQAMRSTREKGRMMVAENLDAVLERATEQTLSQTRKELGLPVTSAPVSSA
ncbi:MAG: hypothetical protein K8R92_00800 [Planctomycetes bacterium]|nr:hypothetical protein [Planctomycetota bacterium]